MRCHHFFHRRDGLSHVFLHFLPQSTTALSTQFSDNPHTDDPPRKASAAFAHRWQSNVAGNALRHDARLLQGSE
jgi:hypothetical protein